MCHTGATHFVMSDRDSKPSGDTQLISHSNTPLKVYILFLLPEKSTQFTPQNHPGNTGAVIRVSLCLSPTEIVNESQKYPQCAQAFGLEY